MEWHLQEDQNLVENLWRENEERENELVRMSHVLEKSRDERKTAFMERRELEQYAQEMRAEIASLTCYARKLEAKLETAAEEKEDEKQRVQEANDENERLLQVIADLELEVRNANNEAKRVNELVQCAEVHKDHHQAEANHFHDKLGRQEEVFYAKLREQAERFQTAMIAKDQQIQAALEEKDQLFAQQLQEKDELIEELQRHPVGRMSGQSNTNSSMAMKEGGRNRPAAKNRRTARKIRFQQD